MKNITINGIEIKNAQIVIKDDYVKVSYTNIISKEGKAILNKYFKSLYPSVNAVFFRN